MTWLLALLALAALGALALWLLEAPRAVYEQVGQVALGALESDEELRRRAAAAAPALDVAHLKRVWPAAVPIPPELVRSHGEAAIFRWPALCGQALYALLEEKGAPALAILRTAAVRRFDCGTHPMASHALCALAARGVGRDETLDHLGRTLPGLDDRVALATMEALAVHRLASPATVAGSRGWIDRLPDDDVEKLDLVRLLAACDPDAALAYAPLLRGWMRGELAAGPQRVAAAMVGAVAGGQLAVQVLRDGTVVEDRDGVITVKEWGADGPPWADKHAIRAAVCLREVSPDDPETNERLAAWAAAHPLEAVREELRRFLEAR